MQDYMIQGELPKHVFEMLFYAQHILYYYIYYLYTVYIQVWATYPIYS